MQRKKLFLLISVLAFSFSFLTIKANAESEISDEKIENIESNCSSIKDTLKRVQNTDKNSRVSLGRSFQTVVSDFITPLNVRLVKNNKFNSELADIQNELVSTREEFNHSYITYSQELETLISINCYDDANSFYSQLETTRKKRSDVLENAKKLEELINEHIEIVSELKASYAKKAEK